MGMKHYNISWVLIGFQVGQDFNLNYCLREKSPMVQSAMILYQKLNVTGSTIYTTNNRNYTMSLYQKVC